jgi:hypothetical protein
MSPADKAAGTVPHAGPVAAVNDLRGMFVPSSGGPITGMVSLLTRGSANAWISLTGVGAVKTSRQERNLLVTKQETLCTALGNR